MRCDLVDLQRWWSSPAKANLVVRDGFASFYFHPFYDIAMLKQIVTGIKQAGYTFVSADDL